MKTSFQLNCEIAIDYPTLKLVVILIICIMEIMNQIFCRILLQLDKEAESGVLLMHVYLRKQQCDIDTNDEACDTVNYGPSTSNQA